MALAPFTVQCMPARLSRVPITTLQPASTTPVEVHKISHPGSMVRDVVDTFPCLWVLTRVVMQGLCQGFQVAVIEFIIARLNPWLAFRAVPLDGLSDLTEVFFGIKTVENLSGLRE